MMGDTFDVSFVNDMNMNLNNHNINDDPILTEIYDKMEMLTSAFAKNVKLINETLFFLIEKQNTNLQQISHEEIFKYTNELITLINIYMKETNNDTQDLLLMYLKIKPILQTNKKNILSYKIQYNKFISSLNFFIKKRELFLHEKTKKIFHNHLHFQNIIENRFINKTFIKFYLASHYVLDIFRSTTNNANVINQYLDEFINTLDVKSNICSTDLLFKNIKKNNDKFVLFLYIIIVFFSLFIIGLLCVISNATNCDK